MAECTSSDISFQIFGASKVKLRPKYLVFIYLFGVLLRFQHCTGHIMTGSWKGRGNQHIQFVRVLYYKLPTNVKQLPTFPLEAVLGTEPWPQRWEARVLPLCRRGPKMLSSLYILKWYKVWDLKEHIISCLAFTCLINTLSRFKERYKLFWITTM